MANLLLSPPSSIAYAPPVLSSHLPLRHSSLVSRTCNACFNSRPHPGHAQAAQDLPRLSSHQPCSCNFVDRSTSVCCSRPSFCDPCDAAAFGHGVRRLWLSDTTMAATRDDGIPQAGSRRPSRSVVEHAVLFRMKEDFSEGQEKDMLDYLYTLQYHCRGILALSLGPVTSANAEGVTHAFFTRFPDKESLAAYMNHPARVQVRDELIRPFYHGLIELDYEANVEDDIEPLFRRGEEFEQGVELVTLIKVKENTSADAIAAMLSALSNLSNILADFLVQLTAGTNFSERSMGYTHGFIARLPSEEALDAFKQHPAYRNVLSSNVEPLASSVLSVEYLVQSVHTTSV